MSGVVAIIKATNHNQTFLILADDDTEDKGVFSQSVLRVNHLVEVAITLKGSPYPGQLIEGVLSQFVESQTDFNQHGV